MSLRISNAAASAAAGDGSNKGFAAYAGSAQIQFFTGSVGATPEVTPSGTNLGSVTTVSYATASNGAVTASSITSGTASNSGTAASFWHLQANGSTPLGDGTVAETSGGDINFNNNVFVSGGTIAMSSMVITFPPH
jgi:hypothetical protein